jgi:hypothetical protein
VATTTTQRPLTAASTPALVREYAGLRVADVLGALNVTEHERQDAVVSELQRRGVLDGVGSTGPTPVDEPAVAATTREPTAWERADTRLRDAQRAVLTRHPGGRDRMNRFLSAIRRLWDSLIADDGPWNYAGCCGCGRNVVDVFLVITDNGQLVPFEMYCRGCWSDKPVLDDHDHIWFPETLIKVSWEFTEQVAYRLIEQREVTR